MLLTRKSVASFFRDLRKSNKLAGFQDKLLVVLRMDLFIDEIVLISICRCYQVGTTLRDLEWQGEALESEIMGSNPSLLCDLRVLCALWPCSSP